MSNVENIEDKEYSLENGVQLGKYTVDNGRMVYYKQRGKTDHKVIEVANKELKDFHVIDNGVRNDIYKFEFENGVEIKGTFKYIVNSLKHNIISGIGNLGHDFISTIISKNPDRVHGTVNGGYTSLDRIDDYEPTKLEIDIIQEEIINFIDQHFSTPLKVAFKLLCLFPFHWIIKTDPNTVNRGLIKGLSLYGVKGAGKSFICLIALNMFDDELILTPTTYSTIAGLTNDISYHIGIILADDCNDLFDKDSKRMDDLNKNIINIEVPNKTLSDGESVSHQKFSSTPVYTSNDMPNFKSATLDRINVIQVLEAGVIPNFGLGDKKNGLRLLGKILASTFKKNYQDIVKTQDSKEASNLLFERSPFDFKGIQTATCDTSPTDNNTPVNVLFKQYISRKTGRQLNKRNIEEAIQKVIPLESYYYKEKKEDNDIVGFYINRQEFYNFIRVLIDDTGREFKKELPPMKPTSIRSNGTTVKAYIIKYKDFINWFNL